MKAITLSGEITMYFSEKESFPIHNDTLTVLYVAAEVDCPPLPQKPDLIYSTDATMLGTKVTFQCKDSNTLIGASDVVCQATGTWSAPLPKCESTEAERI